MSQGETFLKVLLVDDSEIDNLVNRRLMQITHFAHDIITVSTAEAALEFLKDDCNKPADAPDIIFLDMNLPGMNGYDFIEEFIELPSFVTDKTKIIVLSVFQNQDRLKKVLSYPFVIGQLEKPLSQKALLELKARRELVSR